jgi:hypothetical protein
MTYRTSATLVAVLALLTGALAGCGAHQQSDAQDTASTVAQPAAAQPAAATAAQAPSTAAAPADAAAADPTAEPQSATGQVAAAPKGSVASSGGDQAGTKFVVDSIVRGPDVLTLKFTLINDSASPLVTYDRFDASGYHGDRTMSGIHLIDTVAKKKYFPVEDTDQNCLCSQEVADVAPNSQVTLWVKFPAPPANVKKISIEVPHFIPLDDVPIAQ